MAKITARTCIKIYLHYTTNSYLDFKKPSLKILILTKHRFCQ
nr:MAG TPA: hypothetical protein [Caudoviricetes sp.]